MKISFDSSSKHWRLNDNEILQIFKETQNKGV